MTDEQINEVMRLADEIADYAWKQGLSDGAYSQSDHDRKSCDASRAELETYLRTIGKPENTFPLNPNGASKWANLQKHDGAKAIGVVFRTWSASVGSLVDGRVVWADWLARPNGSKPESVNAEMLEAIEKDRDAADSMAKDLANLCVEHERRFEFLHSTNMDASGYEWGIYRVKWDSGRAADVLQTLSDLSDLDAAIARAESAIETPAKVSPCAGHAVQQEADTCRDWPEDFHHENGQYMNTCHVCKNTFIGHKRRAVCKVCNNGFIRAQQEADEAGGA